MSYQDFIKKLNSEDKGWYITKQELNPVKLYKVAKKLFEYQKNPKGHTNFSEYGKALGLFTETNYRQTRNILYLGLAKPKKGKSGYDNLEVSSAFKKLLSFERDFGKDSEEFKNYLVNQTEKMLFPVRFSEECKRYLKLGYKIYPIIFIYKVFLELYKKHGITKISIQVFKVLVASGKHYDDWAERVDLISKITEKDLESEIVGQFGDVRIQRVLKGLRYFNITTREIELRKEYLSEISQKIDFFEKNIKMFENMTTKKYETWLASDEIILKVSDDIGDLDESDLLPSKIDDSRVILKVPSYYPDINSITEINNRKPIFVTTTRGKGVKTDPRLAKTALVQAKYACECNKKHKSFIDKFNKNYVEAHHLMPIKAQKSMPKVNLDRLENIVALCPNCHKAIHLGNKITRIKILTKLTKKRQKSLKKVGVDLKSAEDLLNKHYR